MDGGQPFLYCCHLGQFHPHHQYEPLPLMVFTPTHKVEYIVSSVLEKCRKIALSYLRCRCGPVHYHSRILGQLIRIMRKDGSSVEICQGAHFRVRRRTCNLSNTISGQTQRIQVNLVLNIFDRYWLDLLRPAQRYCHSFFDLIH